MSIFKRYWPMWALTAIVIGSLVLGTGCDSTVNAQATAPDTILAFHADWCEQCERDRSAGYYDVWQAAGYRVLSVDVDVYPEYAKSYGVQHLPTYVILDEQGRELERTNTAAVVLQIIEMIVDTVFSIIDLLG